MVTLSEIRNAIDELLGLSGAGQILQLNTNKCAHAYEAYVLALCVTAVRNAGGSAELRGIINGPNPEILIFRGAPGNMASRNQDFCYVFCTLGNKTFEIHLDVEYVGQSGAKHEIDVALYDAKSADEVRQKGKPPRMNRALLAAMECKFYTTTPGVDLARTFVGLITDSTPNKLNAFLSNCTSAGIDYFLPKSASPEPFTDLTVLNSAAEERFIRSLEQVLRKWGASQ